MKLSARIIHLPILNLIQIRLVFSSMQLPKRQTPPHDYMEYTGLL
jgi:hypothetical protein